jgi:hypothetical protein
LAVVVVVELDMATKVVAAVEPAELYFKKIKPYQFLMATTTQSKLVLEVVQMNRVHFRCLARAELL